MLKWVKWIVKIVALWKRKHFVTSSQATCFLPLVEPASIRILRLQLYWYIQTKLTYHASFATLYICNGIWMKTVGLTRVACIYHWHKVSTHTWFNFITLPNVHKCGSHERVGSPLVYMKVYSYSSWCESHDKYSTQFASCHSTLISNHIFHTNWQQCFK